jgi:hypothetical protein
MVPFSVAQESVIHLATSGIDDGRHRKSNSVIYEIFVFERYTNLGTQVSVVDSLLPIVNDFSNHGENLHKSPFCGI